MLEEKDSKLTTLVTSSQTKLVNRMLVLHPRWSAASVQYDDKYPCNETNLTYYLSSVYSFTITLHVSSLLIVHHQEVTMYICDNWYVLYVLADCQLADQDKFRIVGLQAF
jgi:hypothetical protein